MLSLTVEVSCAVPRLRCAWVPANVAPTSTFVVQQYYPEAPRLDASQRELSTPSLSYSLRYLESIQNCSDA